MSWDWMREVLNGNQFGLAVVAASFLFGLSSAATTAGCGGIPAMLVIVGYTASQKGGKKQLGLAVLSFFVTSILALGLLGFLMSFVGGTVLAHEGSFGFYAKKAMGLVALLLGLTALDLTPFHIPSIKVATNKLPSGVLGAMLVGLSVGIATAGCAGTCSPLQLPIVLGFAALRGQPWEGALILAIFAIGFTFPLVAVMLGIGLGRSAKWMERLDRPLRLVSGIFMVGIAIWFMLMTT